MLALKCIRRSHTALSNVPGAKKGNTIYVARGSPARMDAAEKVSEN